MSLLENIVSQVVKNSLGDQTVKQQNNQNDGLGRLLGQVLGGTVGNGQSQSGLGGLLGGILGQGGQKNHVQSNDLGAVLGSLVASQLGDGKQKGGLNKNALLLALLPVVLNYIQKNGGLSGVLAKFNNNGLGAKAQSWVGLDRDNDGIDASDIVRLFDKQEISDVCQKTGASEQEVCQGIAELLPRVVDDLTPHGDVAADEHQANDEIRAILQQFAQMCG